MEAREMPICSQSDAGSRTNLGEAVLAAVNQARRLLNAGVITEYRLQCHLAGDLLGEMGFKEVERFTVPFEIPESPCTLLPDEGQPRVVITPAAEAPIGEEAKWAEVRSWELATPLRDVCTDMASPERVARRLGEDGSEGILVLEYLGRVHPRLVAPELAPTAATAPSTLNRAEALDLQEAGR